MQEVYNLCNKLMPIIEAGLNCYSKNQQLFPLQDTIHSTQMAYYWWIEACTDLTELQKNPSDIIDESPPETKPTPPTQAPSLISSEEQLTYINSELVDIKNQIIQLRKDNIFPQPVDYKLERGADQIMESIFNMKLAKFYYEQLQGRG